MLSKDHSTIANNAFLGLSLFMLLNIFAVVAFVHFYLPHIANSAATSHRVTISK